MGLGAAINCHLAGHEVLGIDLNPEAREKLKNTGAVASSDAKDAANSDIVLIFVVNAQQADSVLFKSGLVAEMTGGVIVNCVTLEPATAETIAKQCFAAGLEYLDAPVSGGQAKAMSGDMSVMASGSAQAFNAARPALDAMAAKVFELGEKVGNGSRMKLVNQLLAGVHIAATAESLTVAAGMGMDLHEVISVISECAGTSWMFENRGPHIADADYSPRSAVDIFVKDMGIVTSATQSMGLSTPLSDAAKALYAEAQAAGLGREDDSAIAKVLAARGKVELPGGPA